MTSAEQLQDRISYRFRNPDLLDLALTHPSWLQDHPEQADSNQRLEFLGDAVLQLSLTQNLFALFPDAREGELSKKRAALSNGTYLARIAQEIDLGGALRLSESEHESGGREKSSALEDGFEALLGAIFSDSDFETAKTVIHHLYGDLTARLAQVIPEENPKGRLQEKIQHVAGNDHAREYEAKVFLQGQLIGTGRGSSKKSAEEEAAREGLNSPNLPTT